MLRPPCQRQGCCVGPSFGWLLRWMGVLWAGAVGYTLLRPWLRTSLPPLFSTINGIELMLSAVASLGGILIAGVVVSAAAYLFDRYTGAQSGSSASTETAVQPSQETDS